MRLRGPVRVKNPDKVQPEFNGSESATLALCNAMEALLNATACRPEDKKAVTDMIEYGRSEVLEAYRLRMLPPPVVSDWPEGVSGQDQIEAP